MKNSKYFLYIIAKTKYYKKEANRQNHVHLEFDDNNSNRNNILIVAILAQVFDSSNFRFFFLKFLGPKVFFTNACI